MKQKRGKKRSLENVWKFLIFGEHRPSQGLVLCSCINSNLLSLHRIATLHRDKLGLVNL